MTPEEMVLEAVLVALAKGLGAVCIVAMFTIIVAALWKGRAS